MDLLKEVKFEIKLMKGDKKTKAIVVLILGPIKLKGFRIMSNGEGSLWVNPPCILGGGKYHPIFFIEDKDLWHALQAKIIKEYQYHEIPIVEEKSHS